MSATALAQPTKQLRGLVYDMSSEDYHNYKGVYSSSQLKDLLEDEEVFYRKYITKTQEKEHSSAFDVGTFFHTAILEPHKLKDECAVYEGIRRGKEWDAFQLKHAGKAIITKSEEAQAQGIITAVKNSPIAMNRIARGQAEVSAFVTIHVWQGEIFTEDWSQSLGKYGWEKAIVKTVPKKGFVTISLKVRADLLAEDFVLDLKSTTGNAKSERAMMRKVSDYVYDLSAALYLDLFTIATGKVISEFVWTFASKDLMNCKSYTASAKNIAIGRAKWKKAILKLAECLETDWQFEDSMGVLEPSPFEEAILQTNGADLL